MESPRDSDSNKGVDSDAKSPERKAPNPCCKVSRRTLPIKGIFFLSYAAASGVLPYLPIIGSNIGLSAVAVGIVFTVLPFIVLLTKPLIGALSDYLKQLKLVFAAVLLMYLSSLLLLSFVPLRQDLTWELQIAGDGHAEVVLPRYELEHSCLQSLLKDELLKCRLHCDCSLPESVLIKNDNVSSLTYPQSICFSSESPVFWLEPLYQDNLSDSFVLYRNPDKKSFEENNVSFVITEGLCTGDCSQNFLHCDKQRDYSLLQFWLYMLFVVLARISISSIFSLSDTACFEVLENKPRNYGKQRLWGTIGWGLLAPLTGLLIDSVSQRNYRTNYTPGLLLASGFVALNVMLVLRTNISVPKKSANIFKNVRHLLKNINIVLFLFDIFIVGACSGMQWYYLYWYLQQLGASKLLMGLSLATQSFLGDLPFLFISGWMISRIRHINVIRMAFMGFFVKFLAYSFLRNPWYVILIELCQGPTYGSFYAAMASYSKSISPQGTEATVQSLVSSVFDCLGVAAGSFLGGLGFQYLDGSWTFFTAAFVPLTWCVANVTFHRLLQNREKMRRELSSTEDTGQETGNSTPFLKSSSENTEQL